MTTLRALIVDDEALARERIRTLLKSADNVEIVAESTGGREAVDCIIAKHARLHAGRDTHVVRHTLKRLEQRFAQHGFVRVHRSAIVNVDRIKELEPWFHGEYVVILKDGTKLTSSAAHSQALHRIVDAI